MIMKNYFVIKSTGQDICILNLKEAACPCLTRPCMQWMSEPNNSFVGGMVMV